MKKATIIAAVMFSVLFGVSIAFAGESIPNQGFFIEYQKFSKDISWTATVGAKFELARHEDFALAFNGRIETVSERMVDLKGSAGLTDIDYRLEPRLYFRDFFLSFNHWSLHKADVLGEVPNLNLVTVGFERNFGRFTLSGGVNYKMPNSDANYSKAAFLSAEEILHAGAKRSMYARQAVEAFPSAIAKAELGLRSATPSLKLLKTVDVYAGYRYNFGGASTGTFISSQDGIVADGIFGGFRFNF